MAEPSPRGIALVVEDDRPTRALLERLLAARGYQVEAFPTAEAALDHLDRSSARLILLDIHLPGMSGFDFCAAVRAKENGDARYILAATGNNRPEDLRKILNAGANDYISKPFHPGMLDIRLAVAEAAIADIERRKALEDRLRFLAEHDPLTGLGNRVSLSRALAEAVAAARSGSPGSLLYLDLDNFKIVNDSLGHEAGDHLLQHVAAELRAGTGPEHRIFRFGGDEFVIVMPGVPPGQAQNAAQEILERIEALERPASNRVLRVAASIGIAAIDGTCEPAGVMSRADEACYAAKARGRNRVEVHSPRTGAIARLIADADWSARIRAAMRSGSLRLWYQPILHLRDGSCLAQELLLRYDDGTESIAPHVFLDAFRRSGQATQLDRFVIAKAFESLAAHPWLSVSVNISGALFADEDYATFVERTIADSGIQAHRVLFEITESELIENLPAASGAIRRLQNLGCRFGLDDFGAGFCSLSYLKRLPVDFLKIDGSITRDVTTEAFDVALLRGIRGIASALGVKTVAESIETPEELRVLMELGADYGQGHLFAKARREPFTTAEIAAMASAAGLGGSA